MRSIKIALSAFAVLVSLSHAAIAEERMVLVDYDGSFDDATFAVESAIVGAGLVIDYVAHTGAMLERTRADVGSDVVLFDGATSYLFCSASVSRQVMEADPMNIVHCPYSIMVLDRDGKVQIGHALFSAPSMDPVEDLLSELVEEAAAF